ncbi:uncharacterized protein PFL1_04070 [Pseudozyma flocculosa PF-1]|uniref:PXA domain-containing protein n=2 Tax=Pseudozyma flocculosa TaxID=84751 RepID=A0A5C3ETK3_9BASI|nr:uncharacterized protein PFL1_04070 [Pseudozyma flocculosa PF-1]EPQ28243.1 hypothetical protein PFL1_04070 [Pseudozyma flocculosa PF-1]SPO35382.1 uncharacterized protein PSFLO_00853 [Pseudozyma flocculosa]
MPAEVFVAPVDSPSSSSSNYNNNNNSNARLTSPTPSYLSAFPHRPTQPTLTTALHRSHSHVDSLASNPSSPPNAQRSNSNAPAHVQSYASGRGGRLASPSAAAASATDSEPATLFYRRILFADLPSDQPVPALTGEKALDDQIYLLLAYLLRATVLPWYSKLTPNRQLLTEIVAIIRHVVDQIGPRLSVQPAAQRPSRARAAASPPFALERYRLHALVGRELPLVLRQHYLEVRAARRKADTAWAPLVTASHSSKAGYDLSDDIAASTASLSRHLPATALDPYDDDADGTDHDTESEPTASSARIAQLHGFLCPHPGVDSLHSVEGRLDPSYLRIAVSSLLGSLLPPEEWAVQTERYIVRDVTVMALRNSLGKCSRPWFLVQSIHKVLDVLRWPEDSSGAQADGRKRRDRDIVAAGAGATSNARTTPTPLEHVVGLAIRLWSLLTILCTMVLPYVVRAYFDLFDPHAGPARHARGHGSQGASEDLLASSSPSSRSQGAKRREPSLRPERTMHGRYPSASVGSGFLLGGGGGGGAGRRGGRAFEESSPPSSTPVEAGGSGASARTKAGFTAAAASAAMAEYAVPWLQLLEEVTEARTRMLSSALFSLLKMGVGFAGFGQTIDRIVTARVNATLDDTAALSDVVANLRRGMMPDGHLPPPVADPTPEVQAAEWRRLRRRLLQGMHPKVRLVLLGPDWSRQYDGMTRWLSPLCAPDAAGPNTHLAVMVLERVIVMLCPDLVEA